MCTALERLKNESRQEGLQKGRQEGLQKGRQEGIRDLVLEWTKDGYSTEAIARLLKKSEEFVKKIQEESGTLV